PESVGARRLRILIPERSGLEFVRFTHIGIPEAEADAPATDRGRVPGEVSECVHIASIDGTPIRTRIGAHLNDLVAGESVPIEHCDDPLDLASGLHWLGSVDDYALDSVHLSSTVRFAQSAPIPLAVLEHRSDIVRVRFPYGCQECVVSSGQSYDPRWRATVNGSDVGEPTVADGFASGWLLSDGPAGSEVVMDFRPRQAVAVAWLVSAVALAICVVSVATTLRPRRGVRRWRP